MFIKDKTIYNDNIRLLDVKGCDIPITLVTLWQHKEKKQKEKTGTPHLFLVAVGGGAV